MTTDRLIGKRFDEYRLEVLLGQGGMARVYRAIDVQLRRYVAIKVIDSPFRADSEYIMRFEREAQAIARLEHPNIVPLYRYGKAEGLLYMAMRYVEGADLETVLQSYREDDTYIEPEDAGRIIREVCQALDYAHSQNVIHRDVKPANILMDLQGHAILSDFGLVLLTEVGTRGEIFGSPHYVAPEQAISSAGAVPQSDLYAIGVIMYEMFTGELPFDAEEPLDLAAMHMTEPPPLPRSKRPDLNPALEDLILKMLAKEPGDRYATGAELADALDVALQATQKHIPTPAVSSHMSIPQRVASELADNPLPPMPAAVAPAAPPAQPLPPPATPEKTRLAAPSAPPQLRGAVPTPVRSADAPAAAARKRPLLWLGLLALLGIAALVVLAGIFLIIRGAGDDNEGAGVAVLTTETPTASAESESTATQERAGESATEAAVGQVVTTEATVTAVVPPSATPTLFIPPSATPTLFIPPSATPAPTSTPTPSPSATAPPPTATPTPVAAPETYQVSFSKSGDSIMVITNESSVPFPIDSLELDGEGGDVKKRDWKIDTLDSNECVVVWSERGPDPDFPCEVQRLTREPPKNFWKEDFTIKYEKVRFECPKDQSSCIFITPIDP